MIKGKTILKTFMLLFSLVTLSSFSMINNDDTVYICMKGDVYHSLRNCKGLNNVKSKIIAVKKSEAEKKYKRRPCKLCYK